MDLGVLRGVLSYRWVVRYTVVDLEQFTAICPSEQARILLKYGAGSLIAYQYR